MSRQLSECNPSLLSIVCVWLCDYLQTLVLCKELSFRMPSHFLDFRMAFLPWIICDGGPRLPPLRGALVSSMQRSTLLVASKSVPRLISPRMFAPAEYRRIACT